MDQRGKAYPTLDPDAFILEGCVFPTLPASGRSTGQRSHGTGYPNRGIDYAGVEENQTGGRETVILEYLCKFCQKPGQAHYEPLEAMELAKWAPLLCCNRCHDFEVSRRRLGRAINKQATILLQSAECLNSAKVAGVQDSVRKVLEILTKKLCTKTCDHYRKPNIWDIEFVNLLMDRPDMAWQITNKFVLSIKGQAFPEPAETRKPHSDDKS
jgi:hypothetical protein